jgi:diamine N-acetyltransferase
MRNPMIVGERLYLRAIEPEDAEVRARHVARETDTLMERFRIPISPIAYANEVKDIYKHRPPETIFFAVCLKETDDYIGFVTLMDIDWVNRTAETGAWLSLPESRGQGYGPEAKHLLIEYAFDYLQLHLLFAWVWEPNVRSARAVQGQGYKFAGRLRFDDMKLGRYHAVLLFDLLREDWIEARERERHHREGA